MVIKEFFRVNEDGVKLYHFYSDKGLPLIQQPTGVEYTDAIDVENAGYSYIEKK